MWNWLYNEFSHPHHTELVLFEAWIWNGPNRQHHFPIGFGVVGGQTHLGPGASGIVGGYEHTSEGQRIWLSGVSHSRGHPHDGGFIMVGAAFKIWDWELTKNQMIGLTSTIAGAYSLWFARHVLPPPFRNQGSWGAHRIRFRRCRCGRVGQPHLWPVTANRRHHGRVDRQNVSEEVKPRPPSSSLRTRAAGIGRRPKRVAAPPDVTHSRLRLFLHSHSGEGVRSGSEVCGSG